MPAAEPIAPVVDVPTDTTMLVRVRDAEREEVREAILVSIDGEISCWLNECQHFTHIPLDKGSGAPMRNGELVCTNHGAMFDADTGACTFGPCEGAYLPDVEVTVEDEHVYLTDERFSFVGTGPIEDDDDLSSSSNVEF